VVWGSAFPTQCRALPGVRLAADLKPSNPHTRRGLAPPTQPAEVPAGSYEAAHGPTECTQDCSGHEAGYSWAEENGIADEDNCTGNGDSFIEGCQAYVADQG
jgi:hypothetical protein